jgi:transcriptional regulator, LysR family
MLRSKSPRRLPPLHALRAFEAAARHLSVKKAAAELAVTPTAVSHHIRVLETHLGVKLFERHVRQIELTSYGKQLYRSFEKDSMRSRMQSSSSSPARCARS